jgi:hypothetical protein
LDPESDDLWHFMYDGMGLIRLLAVIDPESIDMRAVNKGENLSIFKIRENINYGLTCAKGKVRNVGSLNPSYFLEKKPHMVLGICF